jgi:hypothetical protein
VLVAHAGNTPTDVPIACSEEGDSEVMMTAVQFAMVLVLVFQLKHFIADYLLQGWPWANYMLGKFRPTGWQKPLAAHCAVHAAFTFTILSVIATPTLLTCCLALFDGCVHFVMDRVKASPELFGRWKPASKEEYVAAYAAAVREVPATLSDEEATRVLKAKHRGIVKMWDNQLYFWTLGFDQLVHHCTDLFVIWAVVVS